MDIMKQINNLPEELQNIIFLYIHNPMKKQIEHQPIREGVKYIQKKIPSQGKFRIYNSYMLYRTLNEEQLIKNIKYVGRVVRDENRWEAPEFIWELHPYEGYWFNYEYKTIPKKIITLIRKEYGIRGRCDDDYEKIYKLYHYRYYD
tara:strand:- start:590 stop:1027 length:438 start_codon:yes stop_codon:yes gene_type:complete